MSYYGIPWLDRFLGTPLEARALEMFERRQQLERAAYAAEDRLTMPIGADERDPAAAKTAKEQARVESDQNLAKMQAELTAASQALEDEFVAYRRAQAYAPDWQAMSKGVGALEDYVIDAELSKALDVGDFDAALDLLEKGAGHKYIRRIPTGDPKRKWTYIYNVTSEKHGQSPKVGEKIKVAHGDKQGHYEVTHDHGEHVSMRHDESGHEMKVHKDHVHELFAQEHEGAIDAAHKRLAQTHEAAARHGTEAQQKRAKAALDAHRERFGYEERKDKPRSEKKAPAKVPKEKPKKEPAAAGRTLSGIESGEVRYLSDKTGRMFKVSRHRENFTVVRLDVGGAAIGVVAEGYLADVAKKMASMGELKSASEPEKFAVAGKKQEGPESARQKAPLKADEIRGIEDWIEKIDIPEMDGTELQTVARNLRGAMREVKESKLFRPPPKGPGGAEQQPSPNYEQIRSLAHTLQAEGPGRLEKIKGKKDPAAGLSHNQAAIALDNLRMSKLDGAQQLAVESALKLGPKDLQALVQYHRAKAAEQPKGSADDMVARYSQAQRLQQGKLSEGSALRDEAMAYQKRARKDFQVLPDGADTDDTPYVLKDARAFVAGDKGGKPEATPAEDKGAYQPDDAKGADGKYRYGANNRPVSYANVPKGATPEADKRFRHGIAVYDKPLTAEQVESFELTPVLNAAGTARRVGQVISELGEYASEYTEMIGEDRRTAEAMARQALSRAGVLDADIPAAVVKVNDGLRTLAAKEPEAPAAAGQKPGEKLAQAHIKGLKKDERVFVRTVDGREFSIQNRGKSGYLVQTIDPDDPDWDDKGGSWLDADSAFTWVGGEDKGLGAKIVAPDSVQDKVALAKQSVDLSNDNIQEHKQTLTDILAGKSNRSARIALESMRANVKNIAEKTTDKKEKSAAQEKLSTIDSVLDFMKTQGAGGKKQKGGMTEQQARAKVQELAGQKPTPAPAEKPAKPKKAKAAPVAKDLPKPPHAPSDGWTGAAAKAWGDRSVDHERYVRKDGAIIDVRHKFTDQGNAQSYARVWAPGDRGWRQQSLSATDTLERMTRRLGKGWNPYTKQWQREETTEKSCAGLEALAEYLTGEVHEHDAAESGAESMSKSEAASGLVGLQDYLSKAGIAMPVADPDGLPKGEPKMGHAKSATVDGGSPDGGELEGVGKTSGSGDSAPAPGTGKDGVPTGTSRKKEKLSADDADEEKQMTDHKKPLEQSVMRKSVSPAAQREEVAREHAAKVHELTKAEPDVRVGGPVHPLSYQAVHGNVDAAASELCKSEFYYGPPPTLSPPGSTLRKSVMCKSEGCAKPFAAALTACPHCGDDTVQSRLLPHGGYLGGNGSHAAVVLEKSNAPLLRPPPSEPDLYVPGNKKG